MSCVRSGIGLGWCCKNANRTGRKTWLMQRCAVRFPSMTIRSVRCWPQILPQAGHRYCPKQYRYCRKQYSLLNTAQSCSLLHVGISKSCHQLWITGTTFQKVHVASSNAENDVPNANIKVDIALSMSSLWMVDRPWYHAVVVNDVPCDDWWHAQGQSLQRTS